MVDAFLLKIHITDLRLLFSHLCWGQKNDGAYTVALDASGNPILSGVTESEDFPSAGGAFQVRRRRPIDAFVTKVSADGGRILWST
jgi:hypothetical protein